MSQPELPDWRAELRRERDVIETKQRICEILEPFTPDQRKRVLAAAACLAVEGVANHALRGLKP